ncbi:MAG: M14 family metallopeptidase [Bacteroidetes bacterium]|nr:M14 family metallopeptidase [Bacteroidota bacterium]
MKRTSLLYLLILISVTAFAQNPVSPEKFFGFVPGSDRMLFTYEKLIDYMKALDEQSDMLSLFEIGKSPMGKPMYVVCISSPSNLKNLDALKEINRKLALDASLDEATTGKLAEEGKVFVLATLSMHSVEVAPSQSLPLVAYDWITSADPDIRKALDNVVFMIVPCHNPDGMNMVVNYFNENKGTKYEGSSLPGVYHKYVGHDNNRDFVFLTQSDTKAISALTSTEWFPQVMVEKHQMGSGGPRYFVPPNADPIAENVDASLFIWTGIFGQQMISDMTKAGLKGVTQHAIFDNYWPSSTETCIWKNVIAMLTEAAGCQVAKPIYIEPTELSGGEKGLAEYKKSINMPEPWPGGWWRLEDIVKYERVSMNTMLLTASGNKRKILLQRNELCKKEVALGKTEPPFYYILPARQPDQGELVHLVKLMQEHGIDVFSLKSNLTLEQTNYLGGDIVIPLAQPFRAFIKEVMEKQKYPERHYTQGGILMEPYDITTWSMPLHMGLTSIEIDTRSPELEQSLIPVGKDFTLALPVQESPFTILPSTDNQSFKMAFTALQKGITVKRNSNSFFLNGKNVPQGSFLLGKEAAEILKDSDFPVISATEIPAANWLVVTFPRIALVESWISDMDAGWTRYIFDTYGIGYTVIRPGDFSKGNFAKKFDLFVFPDQNSALLKDGKYKVQDEYRLNNYRPEYSKGIGPKGIDSLISFLNKGGKIISWGESVNLFDVNLQIRSKSDSSEFHLPFHDISEDPGMKGINCPGSLLRMELAQNNSLTWGMGEMTGIFYHGNPIFKTSVPRLDMDRRVIGWFGEEELLMSGFLEGKKLLQNKPVMVWMKKGKGQIVVMGFSPVFRASMPATYKLLFNSILMPSLTE